MLLKRPAPAKLNLGLHVLRRRPDGYHDLETVFLRIAWADHLTARREEALALTCSDPSLPTDESNLVMKAARRLAEEYGVVAGAALHLDKHLPYGAGLGSGSSDAAATLRLLADLWGLDVPEDRLHGLAASLGADVPFFLGPEAAYATGIGDRLAPLLDPETDAVYRCPFDLVVVVPPVHVATAEAYRRVTPRDEERPDLRAAVLSNDLARWREELVNDFEAPILAAYPAIRAAKDALVDAGAGYAALSGSGAAVFGVFGDAAHATAAAEAARLAGHRVWHG
ncbi:MAG: 4-(cytidine 5'-diphospho)-2-C-methyl-D-erythritol kinase [Rhodothermales bacterium]|nr:4-(cytidine 5'-diphospho)-2-C-methyl-D-erythritol kinase [Rhodothermales bacterium]